MEAIAGTAWASAFRIAVVALDVHVESLVDLPSTPRQTLALLLLRAELLHQQLLNSRRVLSQRCCIYSPATLGDPDIEVARALLLLTKGGLEGGVLRD